MGRNDAFVGKRINKINPESNEKSIIMIDIHLQASFLPLPGLTSV